MRRDSMVDTFAGARRGQNAPLLEAAGGKYTGGPTGPGGSTRRIAPRRGSLALLAVGGVEIPWLASGPAQEPPVVLLPGLGWRSTGSVLAEHFDPDLPLVAFDYPRRWPRRPLDTMAGLAQLYLGAIHELGFSRVRLAGVSMGGMLALQLALEAPRVVQSLALVSTAPAADRLASHWRIPLSRAAVALLRESSFYHLYRRWGGWLVGCTVLANRREAELLWSDPMSRRKMADLLRAVSRFDVTARLAEIQAPALVIHGGADVIFPPDTARELAEGLSDARLALIDRAGHFAFLTHFDRVFAELHRFWRGSSAGSGEEEGLHER